MNSSDHRAREEFRWLRLIARLKYDGYRDFQAGMRFIESLVTWLQQFKSAEREMAYGFVRKTLVYIEPNELQRLVEQIYSGTVRARLIQTGASERVVPTDRILADPAARPAIERLRRQTLLMGRSDGVTHLRLGYGGCAMPLVLDHKRRTMRSRCFGPKRRAVTERG